MAPGQAGPRRSGGLTIWKSLSVKICEIFNFNTGIHQVHVPVSNIVGPTRVVSSITFIILPFKYLF